MRSLFTWLLFIFIAAIIGLGLISFRFYYYARDAGTEEVACTFVRVLYEQEKDGTVMPVKARVSCPQFYAFSLELSEIPRAEKMLIKTGGTRMCPVRVLVGPSLTGDGVVKVRKLERRGVCYHFSD